MQSLKDLSISNIPNGDEKSAAHLNIGMKVAITEEGLRDHNRHNMLNKVAIGSTLGFVALPALIGGGIGLAVGGEAVGLGLAELGVIGSCTGAVVGKVVDKPKTGHAVDSKHVTLSLVDMVGVVVYRSGRWFDQPGHDVEVKWYA